jgi:hypothetical protein
MSDSKEKLLNRIAEMFRDEPALKGFYGSITFNIAGGECKNITPREIIGGFAEVKQTILPENRKSS